jgi:hypothetical protein
MNIRHVDSPVICGAEMVGKWYCSDSAKGSDGHPVHRYLQKYGSWGSNCHYFDTEAEVQAALAYGFRPDFGMDQMELVGRASVRKMTEESFDRDFDPYS